MSTLGKIQRYDDRYLQEYLRSTASSSSKKGKSKLHDMKPSPGTSNSMNVNMKPLRSRKEKDRLKNAERGTEVKREVNVLIPKIIKKDKRKSLGESCAILCKICYDKKSLEKHFSVKGCNHMFCKDCMKVYIGTKVKENIANIKCPDENCHITIEPKSCRDVISLKVLEKWESALCEATIDISQRFYCPFKDCSALLMNDDGKGEKLTACECPYCHRLFCAQCRVPWHADLDCAEFQRSKKKKGVKKDDDLILDLAKKNKWMRCRSCGYVVERKSHCEHITCRCGHEFCYMCGENWKHGHLCGKASNNDSQRHAPLSGHLNTVRRGAISREGREAQVRMILRAQRDRLLGPGA